MRLLSSVPLFTLLARITTSYILKIALLSPMRMSTSVFSTLDGSTPQDDPVDPEYPGTAVLRMQNIRARARALTAEQLNADWQEVRRHILRAGGLRDLPHAAPGQGYTGHSFNDFNHCDLTAMRTSETHNNNEGKVAGIAHNNRLGPGILAASLPELGAGGSWSTCMLGCGSSPPQDVAHLQFRSRVAFKLVWAPPAYRRFVVVDDDGALLNSGEPAGELPALAERRDNYKLVAGSKYAVEADKLGALVL